MKLTETEKSAADFKRMREEAGLTLAQAAERSGYSVATINGLENKGDGSERLRDKLLGVYEDALGLVVGVSDPEERRKRLSLSEGEETLKQHAEDILRGRLATHKLGRLRELLVEMIAVLDEDDTKAASTSRKKNLASDVTGNKRPLAPKEKRVRRPAGSLTDVAAVSVGLFECPAGGPLLPANRIGKVKVNPGRWAAADLFALRLNGDSMDRAGLASGDVVLCVWAERREPESGDVVVAHLLGDGCTLKRLHGPEGKRWLEPESTNPAHARIALDGEGEPQAVIQAVMVGKV